MIHTKNLILRKFRIEDVQNMYENWAKDDRVTKFLTWKAHTSISDSEKMIKKWMNLKDNIQFAICDLNDKNIGTISCDLINKKPKTYSIGYCLGYEYWNKGYMTEALKAAIEYLFENKNAVRVQARHDKMNVGSGKVMKKSHMKYEGCLRKSELNNTGICDICLYSMIDDDYELDCIVPSFEELIFRQELLADEKTMDFNRDYGGTIDFPKEKWKSFYDKWTQNDDRHYYYIMVQNKPVGECCIYPEDGKNIVSIIIKDEYRGNGYGKKSLEFLIRKAKELGITKLYDEIAIGNPSINLFLKLGFKILSEDDKSKLVCKEIN